MRFTLNNTKRGYQHSTVDSCLNFSVDDAGEVFDLLFSLSMHDNLIVLGAMRRASGRPCFACSARKTRACADRVECKHFRVGAATVSDDET